MHTNKLKLLDKLSKRRICTLLSTSTKWIRNNRYPCAVCSNYHFSNWFLINNIQLWIEIMWCFWALLFQNERMIKIKRYILVANLLHNKHQQITMQPFYIEKNILHTIVLYLSINKYKLSTIKPVDWEMEVTCLNWVNWHYYIMIYIPSYRILILFICNHNNQCKDNSLNKSL